MEQFGEYRERSQIGPKESYSSSSEYFPLGAAKVDSSYAYSSLYFAVYGLQFLLLAYAVSVGIVSVVGYANNGMRNLECPAPCTNGEQGPTGDSFTCPGNCSNGTNGINGINAANTTTIPSFGQWNFNAMTESSPPPLSVLVPSSFFIPVDNSGGATGGVFSTNNSTIFSSSGNGFNVIYNGPDGDWVTISCDIQIFRPPPYFLPSQFYIAVYWESPDIAPPDVITTIGGLNFDGVGSWWSLSMSSKMQVPNGVLLQAYVALISGVSDNTFEFNYFNLLIEYTGYSVPS